MLSSLCRNCCLKQSLFRTFSKAAAIETKYNVLTIPSLRDYYSIFESSSDSHSAEYLEDMGYDKK